MCIWLVVLFFLIKKITALSHHHRKKCMKQIYKEHIPWINLLPLNLKSRRVTSKLRRILTKTSAFQQQVYSSLSSNQRYENEHSLKKDLEIEVEALRKTLDDLTIITTDLEQEVEGMRKELILMKKRHEKVGRPRSHQHSSEFVHFRWFNNYRRNHHVYASPIVLQSK